MMKTQTSSILKNLLIVFLVFAGLYYAKGFLMPLSVAAVMATLFLPFCNWMERNRVPKGIAALICLLTLLLVATAIGALLGWQIAELTDDIVLIKQRALETGARIQQYIFYHLGISAERQMEILKDQRPSVIGVIPMMAGSLANVFTDFVLVLVYIFFLLYYRIHIKHFLLKLSPPAQRDEMSHVVFRASHVSQQYLVGLAKMIVCLWIMYGIGFSVLGVKNAIFFAIICGLLEIVPFIGNITGTTITVLVAAVNGASLTMLGGVVVTYAIVQLIQGWILEPLIVGAQVKINALFTIIALVIGELVWGIPGIFLAIPLTAMIKIVCDHIESLKPYGFLMGEIETGQGDLGMVKKLKSWFNKSTHNSVGRK
ncbi:MAG: AI-2E family transporter [Bacteroidia bacterium]|nr:AI-2E family transporter [Bacteroidia bacterium]